MTKRTKTTAATLTGALALSSVGFALGSQAGDGTAGAQATTTPTATSTTPAPPAPPKAPEKDGRFRGPDARLGDAAKDLGVSEDKLRDALEKVRAAQTPPSRDDHTAALAKALGISVEQLEAAQKKVREEAEAQWKARREALVAALAKELGVSEDKVRDVLGDGPGFGHGGPGHWRGPR